MILINRFQLLDHQIEHYTNLLTRARQMPESENKVRRVAFLRCQLWGFQQQKQALLN